MRVSIVSRWDEMDCSRSCLVRSNVAYWDGENVMEDNSDWIWDSLDAVVVRFDASLEDDLCSLFMSFSTDCVYVYGVCV